MLLLLRFGAKKISKITQKMSPMRINKGEYTPLKGAKFFAILHKYTKHKFIANIDKTTLNINHFAYFKAIKRLKICLQKPTR